MRRGIRREAQVISFMLALTRGAKGRYSLSKELGLGEGVLKGIYRELRNLGLIAVGKGGAWLTSEGCRELERLLRAHGVRQAVVLDDLEAWGRRFVGVAAAIEGSIVNVVEARDAAVRAGAQIALIVKRSGGRLYLPMVEDYDLRAEAPNIYEALASMAASDYYVVVLGDELYPCVMGLLNAAALAQLTR